MHVLQHACMRAHAYSCDAYQLCQNFAIDTDDKVFNTSSSFKFFTSGKAGLAPAPDGWHMWLKTQKAQKSEYN